MVTIHEERKDKGLNKEMIEIKFHLRPFFLFGVAIAMVSLVARTLYTRDPKLVSNFIMSDDNAGTKSISTEENSMLFDGRDGFDILPNYYDPPTLKRKDLIYNDGRNTVPIVIEEYNLVFFLVAKAASSEWIRFFMRLEGSEDWCGKDVHHRHEDLTYLSDYSIEEAQEIMTSPHWTRAIFVRHPKPRILSAFLDKAINREEAFIRDKCKVYGKRTGDYEGCVENKSNFSFFLYNITTVMNENVHWRSIYSRIDEKWWPWINYVANMENLNRDAKYFLKSIHSNADGISAWDRIGKTGWGDNERNCDQLGTSEFLAKKDLLHKTNARDKMRQYYTPELEKFVETRYARDLHNPYFSFSELHLFDSDAVNE